MPVGLLVEAHRPAALVWRVDQLEVADHLAPADGEEQDLHRHVEMDAEVLRHWPYRALERSEVAVPAAHLEVHVVIGCPGIEPARAGRIDERDPIFPFADVL